MIQLQWRWTGWSGGPGYTTFYVGGVDQAQADTTAAECDAFFASFTSLVPTGLSIRSTGVWKCLNSADGTLIDLGSLTTLPDNHPGSGSAAFAASTGVCVEWLTSAHGPSRPRKGRSYLVPLTAFIYQTDGTISDSIVTSLSTEVTTLATNTDAALGVWKRPSPGGSDGVFSDVIGGHVLDIASVLRSRRR